MNFITKFVSHIFSALIISSLILFLSCEDFQSKEFEITELDASACTSLGDTLSETLTAVLLSEINSTWVDSLIYDVNTNTYNSVPQILDTLEARGIMLTDSPQKFKLETVSSSNDSYFSLNTNSSQLVFFFDKNVDVNIIRADGTIIQSGNPTIPLETTAGCVAFDEVQKRDVPVIQSRISIGIPESRTLVKIIKNEQTGTSTFHVAIM